MRRLFSERLSAICEKIPQSRFLCLLSGVLCGLSIVFPVFGGIAVWVALIPYFLCLLVKSERGKVRDLFGHSFLFFFAYEAVAYHWIFGLIPLDFLGDISWIESVAVALLGVVGISALHAVFSALILTAVTFLTRFLPFSGPGKRISLVPILASSFAVSEWVQTLGWFAVPFARLPLALTAFLPALQTASLFGAYFSTALIATVNVLFAEFLLTAGNAKRLCAAFAALLFGVNLGVGSILFSVNGKAESTVRVAAVQENLPSTDKWSASSSEVYGVCFPLCEEAIESGADVILLPESALPFPLLSSLTYLEDYSALADEEDVTLMLGVFTESEEGMSTSVVTVLPNGAVDTGSVYAKRHLVPFGEYVPWRPFFETFVPMLTELNAVGEDLVPGDGTAVHPVGKNGEAVASLICFDTLFDGYAREAVNDGADFLAVSTNDSWFDGTAAIGMHHSHAVLRAVENGRSVITAANTGRTSAIAPNGETIDSLAVGERGVLTVDLPIRTEMNGYAKCENTALFASFFVLLAEILTGIWNKFRKRG